jgi:dihydroorotase
VVVDAGKVADILEPGAVLPEARELIDAEELHVLPGLVDPDVKFREPGQEYKEDWRTGSNAAVCGGITTVIEMPNPVVPVRNVEELQAKLSAVAGRSRCNYALTAMLSHADLDQVPGLADAGVCGFRCLLPSQFGPVPLMSSGEILDAMQAVAATGIRIGVVPDTADIIRHARDRVIAEGRVDGAAWRDARPPEAEVEGIARMLALAGFAGAKLAISVVAAKQSVPWIRRAKEDGRIDLVAETKPHYCVVDGTTIDTEQLGSMLTMSPPVRTLDHADAVLAALADGTIDALGTDHSPHTFEEKHYRDRMNGIWRAHPGWPGLETTVSLMLTAVNEGRLTIERYAEAHSEAPARAWGLWPRKGQLARGADGDVTIVDLCKRGVFDETKMHSRFPMSPFHGRAFVGAPVCAIVAGEVVARNGDVVAGAPLGRFVAAGT